MQKTGLSMLATAIVLVAGLTLSGCASTPTDVTLQWTPERIYQEAKDEISAGAWDKAIGYLEKLEGRAAGTVLAQQAQIDKAYAQYRNGDKFQAIATLERFIRLHPTSPGLDYAMYLKGLVNFNDNLGLFSFVTRQDLSERDQKAARDSYEAFRELVSRFPESRYAADARQRMTYIVNSLAAYEVHVARFYISRGAYTAAINRAQQAITDFQGVPAIEEALAILVHAYGALGMDTLRDDARRVLEKNYPQSAYLRDSGKAVVTTKSPWWKLW
jgi:outer membrane protein assembly factor BamD